MHLAKSRHQSSIPLPRLLINPKLSRCLERGSPLQIPRQAPSSHFLSGFPHFLSGSVILRHLLVGKSPAFMSFLVFSSFLPSLPRSVSCLPCVQHLPYFLPLVLNNLYSFSSFFSMHSPYCLFSLTLFLKSSSSLFFPYHTFLLPFLSSLLGRGYTHIIVFLRLFLLHLHIRYRVLFLSLSIDTNSLVSTSTLPSYPLHKFSSPF